ncbi:hypothetical protein RAS_14370 [Rickettsia asiatica]|uniref:Uncharacterized protein n=1 Tax=Rickettsia asiatica TaxID=238800 RepID=A0A510G8U0_9RICK|nr:hypothetical protein [Rickettsia asiatica]BBJ32328.1 hypothetical protein RAS_14370 [Rickettsia asiatica]
MPTLNLVLSDPCKYKELNLKQQNLIIDLLFLKLGFKDQKIQYQFKSPFDEFLQLPSNKLFI